MRLSLLLGVAVVCIVGCASTEARQAVCGAAFGVCRNGCSGDEFRWHNPLLCGPSGGDCCVRKSAFTAEQFCHNHQGICKPSASQCGAGGHVNNRCRSGVCCKGTEAWNLVQRKDTSYLLGTFKKAILDDFEMFAGSKKRELNVGHSSDMNWLHNVGLIPVERKGIDETEKYKSKWFTSSGEPQPTYFDRPANKFILHTLEARYPATGDYEWSRYGFDQAGYWPHFTVGYKKNGAMGIVQHVPLNRPSLALKANNLERCIQVEIGGKSDIPFHLDRGLNQAVAMLWRAVSEITNSQAFSSQSSFKGRGAPGQGVPISVDPSISFHADHAYGPRAQQRLTVERFRAVTGLLGHQHVPGNSHWDPGQINSEFFTKVAIVAKKVNLRPTRYDTAHSRDRSGPKLGMLNQEFVPDLPDMTGGLLEPIRPPLRANVPMGRPQLRPTQQQQQRPTQQPKHTYGAVACRDFPSRTCQAYSLCIYGVDRGQCPGKTYCCKPKPEREIPCKHHPDRVCRLRSECGSKGFTPMQCPGQLLCCNN